MASALSESDVADMDDALRRALARVRDTGAGCWLYEGPKGRRGYGLINIRRGTRWKMITVHRLVYLALVGPIGTGMQIDHLCRVTSCCNPSHLEQVTCRENLMRGETICATNAAKTHCPQGHLYEPSNLRASRAGFRQCLTCHRIRERSRREASRISMKGEI